jgi:hypothetical protein
MKNLFHEAMSRERLNRFRPLSIQEKENGMLKMQKINQKKLSQH